MRPAHFRTVTATLASAAAKHPDATALVFEGRSYTFSTLRTAALIRLAALRAAGITIGDDALVMLDNTDEAVLTWLGLAMAGAVEIPVNTAFIGETLRHIVHDSGARTIVTESAYVNRLTALDLPGIDCILVVDDATAVIGSSDARVRPLVASPTEGIVAHERDELEELAVMYTSGTTGHSKGATITERHAYEYAAGVADLLELTEGDVYYAPLPLFHIAGRWAVVYAALQRGACTVLVRRFSISSFWADVREHRVTTTFLLGAMAQFVLNQPSAPDDADNTLDRVLMVPLIEGVDEFRARFGVRVTTCFGSTEANVPIVSCWDASLATGLGRPRAGFRVRVVDAEGHDVAPGVPGELLVAGDEPGTTVLRYHRNLEATRSALADGWVHTGDVVAWDENGNLHFVDRLKDALRRRGENISSFEVERELRSHPAVLECAVVGVDSVFSEQEIAAFVQLAPGAAVTAEELRAHVAERAPKFLVPDQVHFVSSFPLTPTGKIQKFELRQRLHPDPVPAPVGGNERHDL